LGDKPGMSPAYTQKMEETETAITEIDKGRKRKAPG